VTVQDPAEFGIVIDDEDAGHSAFLTPTLGGLTEIAVAKLASPHHSSEEYADGKAY
jgi:hypothetical protein